MTKIWAQTTIVERCSLSKTTTVRSAGLLRIWTNKTKTPTVDSILIFQWLNSFPSRTTPKTGIKKCKTILIWMPSRTTNRLKLTLRKSKKNIRSSSVRLLVGLCLLINSNKEPKTNIFIVRLHRFARILISDTKMRIRMSKTTILSEGIVICSDSKRLTNGTSRGRIQFNNFSANTITSRRTVDFNYFMVKLNLKLNLNWLGFVGIIKWAISKNFICFLYKNFMQVISNRTSNSVRSCSRPRRRGLSLTSKGKC